MTATHLWIVRHGKANPDSHSGKDADRALTDRGVRQAAHLAQLIADHAHAPAALLTSPAVRARSTASPIGMALSMVPVEHPALRVDTPVSVVIDLVVGHPARERGVCVVGHNPTLESLAAVLVEGLKARPNRLRTGEAVLVRFDPRSPIGSGEELARERLDD